MTDEQIRVELARRVMGWERDSECYWDPFTDWNDAMGLAGKWCKAEKSVHQMTRFVDGSWRSRLFCRDSTFLADAESGPRAVTMAIAKAAGIEVER